METNPSSVVTTPVGGAGSAPLVYSLETLFKDQNPKLVNHTIAPVLAWVPGRSEEKRVQPFVFQVSHAATSEAPEKNVELRLDWSELQLGKLVPNLAADVAQMRSGETALHEDIAKLAAYGLAFVAISVLMPGCRVVRFNKYSAPDLLIDDTPGKLVGVEVAGRTGGGPSALKVTRFGDDGKSGKHFALLGRTDIAEAHLSLWCASSRIGIVSKVKP